MAVRLLAAVSLLAAVAAGLIKGIGAKFPQKMVTTFGTAVFDVIEKEPDRLAEALPPA